MTNKNQNGNLKIQSVKKVFKCLSKPSLEDVGQGTLTSEELIDFTRNVESSSKESTRLRLTV